MTCCCRWFSTAKSRRKPAISRSTTWPGGSARNWSGGTRIGDGVNASSGKLVVANTAGSATGSGPVTVQATQLSEERTQAELERQRLTSELETTEREQQAEAERATREQRAEKHAAEEQVRADAQQRSTNAAARKAAKQVEDERTAREQDAARLQDEARRAEARADAIDPKESA